MIGLGLSVCICLLGLFFTQVSATENAIIYEYEIITQKKGEPFADVLKKSGLNQAQQKWVTDVPIYHAAKSDRQLRFSYAIINNQRLLKELKVTRGNRMVNFVLVKRDGQSVFVKKDSEIPAKQRKEKVKLQSTVVAKTPEKRPKPTAKPPAKKAKVALESTAVVATPPKQTKAAAEKAAVKAKKTTTKPITLASTTADKVIGIRFTQAQGQPLEAAWQVAKLSQNQQRIINSGDFIKTAKSQRQFTLFYQVEGNRKLLKGMQVKRGAALVNYAVKSVNNQLQMVNLKTLDDNIRRYLTKEFDTAPVKVLAAKPVQLISAQQQLLAVRFNQYQGQSLQKACEIAKLSPLQLQIVQSGDFLKEAKSTRQLTLYFSQEGGNRLLKGLTVVRNQSRVDYQVKKVDGKLALVNLKTLAAEQQTALQQQFAKADVKQLKTPKPVVAQKEPAKKASAQKSASVSKTSSGKYQIISIKQNKGQTLYSALQAAKLGSKLRNLVITMPASKAARSTRTIHLLLEKNQLRALRIVRGKNVAEYVLVKHQGRLTWANDKGQITAGGGNFTRYPVRFSRVSSPFSYRRRHPITGKIRPHLGIDLKAPHGEPVYAPAPGVVTFSGRQRGYGIILEIDHQNGYRTKYAHLSRIMRSARKGMRIKKGQLIAKVGNTGVSTGSHLHYEVLVNGVPKNPATVKLPGGGGMKTLSSAKSAVNSYLPRLRRINR